MVGGFWGFSYKKRLDITERKLLNEFYQEKFGDTEYSAYICKKLKRN